MPNSYEPPDPSHEFTWTAPAPTNGNGHAAVTNGNGHGPAASNGNGVKIRAPHADSTARDALEFDTGSLLLFAQRVADDTIADARREADRIIAAAHAALPPPAPAPDVPDPRDVAELRELSQQLKIESRLRNLLMNDLIECVGELSKRVEHEIGEAMELLEDTRERALADFSAINALARLAGLPPDAHPGKPDAPRAEPTVVDAADESLEPVSDTFVIDLRDALQADHSTGPHDEFDELFANRGMYMESRESRRSRWIRSAGLFSTVLGNHRAEA